MMVEGEAELLTAVEALRGKSRAAQSRAIESMVKTFKSVLQDNIPYGMKHGTEIHLKEDVGDKSPRRYGGRLEAKVGLSGSTSTGALPAWYAHFVDTGTIKTPPSFFSTRSREQASPELKQEIIDTFRSELE